MGGKQKRLAKEQANGMPLTRAQVLMRDDILGGASEQLRRTQEHPVLFDDEIDDETPEQHVEPMPLHQALDAELGKLAQGRRDQVISQIALEVINQGPILQLALKDWTTVQALIESGIRAGSDAEQSGRL